MQRDLSELGIGVALLISWIGWGSLFSRLLPKPHRLGWAQQGAAGACLLICIGGIAEVLRIISAGLIGVLFALGILLWGLEQVREKNWLKVAEFRSFACKNPKTTATLIMIAMLVVVRFSASVHSPHINPHDDSHAYLVFPQRMLAEGHMGADPFNHRRLVTALGGKSFLDAMVQVWGSPHSLHLVDAGFGFVLVVGLLAGWLAQRRVQPLVGAAVVLCYLLMMPPAANMAALELAVALILSLYLLLEDLQQQQQKKWVRVAALAVTCGGLCALKNTYALVAFLIILFFALHSILRSRTGRANIFEVAGIGAGTILLLLPWAISLYRSSGTFLYPIFGYGVDASQYGPLPFPEQISIRLVGKLLILTVINLDFAALLAGGLLLTAATNRWQRSRAPLCALISAGLVSSVLVIQITTAGASETLIYSVHRYCFALLVPALLSVAVAAAEVIGSPKVIPEARKAATAALLIIGFAVATKYGKDLPLFIRGVLSEIHFGISNRHRFSAAETRQLQRHVPPGEKLLLWLDTPFLADFGRNPIYVIDHPAMVSPAPGMPSFAGPEALAHYFSGQGIRYLAFSYKNRANMSRRRWGHLMSERFHPLWRRVAALTFDFSDNLMLLGQSRKRLADTGQAFVLDLEKRIQPDPQPTGSADTNLSARVKNRQHVAPTRQGLEGHKAVE